MLHLFSGIRRTGDIQWQFETLAQGLACYVLSVDIANDRVLGNLADTNVVLYWTEVLQSGQVVGIISGPPCETWTIARGRSFCSLYGHAPRPLRQRTQLWGMAALSPAEREQVNIGNALLRTTITMLNIAAGCGISGLMEHPATAWWEPGSPSAWLLEELTRLKAHPAAEMIHIDQCSLGQASRKPTQILAIWLPEAKRLLHGVPGQGRCTHRTHRPMIGVDPITGEFRTAALKAYPAPMCAWMAGAVFARWRHVFNSDDGEQLTEQLSKFYVPNDPYCSRQRGADYAFRKKKRQSTVDWILHSNDSGSD